MARDPRLPPPKAYTRGSLAPNWSLDPPRRLVDVAINVFGKPNQTAVTLLSLLAHSGQWVDRIWFVQERRQPFEANFDAILDRLKDQVNYYKPPLWLGGRSIEFPWIYRLRSFRHSIRYQRAWELTDKAMLFITHNDVLYSEDIIGAMLERVGANIAIGPVGQCWNCPAHYANICSPERFMGFRPTYEEWLRLASRFPGTRNEHYDRVVDPRSPWPLPECRVNEWSVLVDLTIARAVTLPKGTAIPIGASYGLDTGTKWFHDVINAGCTVAHFDISPFAKHAWASSTGGGYAALTDEKEYLRTEAIAADYINEHFPTFRG